VTSSSDDSDPVRPARSFEEAVGRLAATVRHDFDDPDLLVLAVTHRSWCAEHPGDLPNERLEFLGDAVLGVVVTDHLFRTHPELPEGELAKARAWVVSAPSLAQVAAGLGLGEALRLGKGEHRSGGRAKPSILADAFEAVIGAIYLDGGLEAARRFVLDRLEERIDEAADGPGGHDHKTQLQELAARLWEELPVYELRDEGPDHDKRFYAVVRLAGVARGDGEGRSKKQAEQAAARMAWDRLVIELGDDAEPTRVGRRAEEESTDA
jgi:ribonuclease-3